MTVFRVESAPTAPTAAPTANGAWYRVRRCGRSCRPGGLLGVLRAALLVLPALLLASAAASAQSRAAALPAPRSAGSEVGPAPSPETAAAARAHFMSGVEHYRARRYRDAIRELQVSRSLVPNPEIWFNVGRAHEQLGELQLAVDHYRSYLRDRPESKDALDVQARITELEQRIEAARIAALQTAGGARAATLVLEVTPPSARVRIDDAFLDGETDGRVLTVTPGVHALDAVQPGYLPHHARADVEPGGLRAAYLELEPLEPRADRPRSRPLVWIAAGLSGAGLLATGVFAVASASARDSGDGTTARGLERAGGASLASAVGLAVVAAVLEVTGVGSREP